MYYVICPDVWDFGPLGLCLSLGHQWAPVHVYYLVLELMTSVLPAAVVPGKGKGVVQTGLALSRPLGVYA